VVIWLRDGETSKLSPAAAHVIESHRLIASQFVRLELQYLLEIGRLDEPPDVLLGYLQDRIDLRMCALPTASIVGTALIQTWTRDPFDRLITANADAAAAILVTRDRAMRRHYLRALF
jgi:PIN domain nuclease of toxin-antitoxin system